MVESRLNKPLAIAAIVVALILGVLLGITSGLANRIFGGPDPKTIATSSLESMRAQTLNVRIPDIEIAGPEVDLGAAREYGSGGVLATLTNAETQLDEANRARAVADLRKQAQAEVPMRLARDAARQAMERSFSMPLKAAGFENAKVVARFDGEEGTVDPSYLDKSTPYNEAIAEAQRRRAAEGNK
jgi:hypothetical protein